MRKKKHHLRYEYKQKDVWCVVCEISIKYNIATFVRLRTLHETSTSTAPRSISLEKKLHYGLRKGMAFSHKSPSLFCENKSP